ncbi:MAG: hypothetical protein P8X74_24040, partial [Reinekea sp.]
MSGEEETTLVFSSEEERTKALNAMPDEPPPGVDIEEWQDEQDRKAQEIMSAEISEEKVSPQEPEGEVNKSPESTSPADAPPPQDDDFVDFTALGKVKRSELPENLRHYPNPHEILKQADHARKFANTAEEKLHSYETRLAELEPVSKTVPELRKQLNDMQVALEKAKREVSADTTISRKDRGSIKSKLESVNAHLSKLREYGGEDAEALQLAISGVVDTLNGSLEDVDSVRAEFDQYKKAE